ncbi:hypothetical protein SAMN05216223_119102 [Actinacidiphila yanglinensis]|uniref:Uncharacterized protein n=1 Tax=Actinacidiphila yanglinensis TaxID=310779 RepID=A0A1H6DV55_9ACTN|nr:DUF6228 family protein [Actinacidiphila yanglinensis]SEG88596.1 hypothetical protein SAMN05216223_119102 [Actinacidiphila yanglinensis]
MTPSDGHIDDDSGVFLRCQDNPSVGVRFCDRFSFDQDSVHDAVEAWAPGLTARVGEVVTWSWDRDLATFLDELVADFRGWKGERTWQTDDRDLAVSARFGSGGHIGLTWTLRPWPDAAGGWNASVTTWLEAGEQLASLAADIRHFLAE